jgi:hypothetical protein
VALPNSGGVKCLQGLYVRRGKAELKDDVRSMTRCHAGWLRRASKGYKLTFTGHVAAIAGLCGRGGVDRQLRQCSPSESVSSHSTPSVATGERDHISRVPRLSYHGTWMPYF